MSRDWGSGTPQWRKDGRTGPGPIAPKYRDRRDRAAVRKGGTPGGPPPERKCCPTGMAVDAFRRGKFRLARRYAVMAARLIVARIA